MKKFLGIVGAVIATLLGLVVLLSIVAVVLLNSGALNGLIEGAIAAQIGRPAQLEQAPSLGFDDGALTLDLGPLSVAKAKWAADQHANFARIQGLQASLRLLPLLRGRVELPEVAIERPQLHLARSKDGEVNWPEGDDTEGGRVWLPEIENLVIRDAAVTYADAAAATEVTLALDEATGRLGGRQDLALHATGTLQDAPLEVRATGGSVMELLNREAMSKPAEIEATIGESRITAQATSFTDLTALDAKIEIDAEQKLAEILASMGLAKAALPPFEATAQVEPGEGGSLVSADFTLEGASAHIDGKVEDLSAPLEGFVARFTVNAPELGPVLASFDVPHAEQLSSASLEGEAKRKSESTTVALSGDVGGDSIELQAGYEGGIAAFLNPKVDLSLEGAALGVLPAQLGVARRPIESYRIAAQVEERSGETSPVKLDVTIEKTRVRFDGSIDELRAFEGVDGRIRLEGPDPAAVLDLFKLPAISLPPYDVAGQFTWRGDDIKVTAFDGKVGDSDARGEIALDLSADPPAVVADLQSDRLDFDDLAGLIGAPPATGEGETASAAQERKAERRDKQERLLPEARIDPKAWQNLNLNVRYSADLIESENLPIDRIKVHVVSKDGWLIVDPLETGLADGSILVFVSLDGTQVPVAVEFDGRIEALQLQDMLAKLEVSGEGLGEFNGRIRLEGSGTSVDQVLGSASGQTVLTMTGGGLDALIVEAIGLDIAESLMVLLDSLAQSEEDKVPIRCAIVNLQLDQGIARARPVVIDTTDSKFIVDGTINLRNETLDLFLQSYPKDVSPLSFNQPIHVDGPLLSPSVNPAPGKTKNEVLGWLLAPVAALLPFFDVGGEEDSPCGSLLAQAKEAAQERPPEPID
jgi:uncharacterized protein involved in outer membrane biogenesis